MKAQDRRQITFDTMQTVKLDRFMTLERRRDTLTAVLDIVRELEKEFKAPVNEAIIMQRAWEQGINELEVSAALERLKIDTEAGGADIEKSKSPRQIERDRLTHVLDIVRELEKEYNAPVLKSEIVERAVKEGISENEVENALERLKLDGQIYDPNRNERYKVV